MTLKSFLGIFLGILSLAGLVLTVLVLIAVMKICVNRGKNPFYILAAANMLADCMQLVLTTAYLAPSIVADSFLFGKDRNSFFVQIFNDLSIFCWYYGSIVPTIIAINSFSFDHVLLSYSWIFKGDTPNYVNTFVDLPMDIASSAVCGICYSYIIFYVWKTAHFYKTGNSGSTNRVKEYRYALQFCAISVFYFIVWFSFLFFPMLIGTNRAEFFIVIPISVTMDASMNGLHQFQ
ncbi:hypothetical protein OESDEN_03002 [Oesophagostomum dentatum]|uniref:7TM GPCR serpentine receptor class x (Srx) domain-containing protein n=1 Tax=Oesophagostomum dentatum TaxID=61180 RepID=A0A0B1TLQ4_OESDE|nr:hypothetical protein OESDEN_03002 [Oesophagostomum dentatum]